MRGNAAGDTPAATVGRVRRAAAYAAVGTLAIAVPIVTDRLGPPLATVAAAGPFVLIAAVALYVVESGPLFELFARPGDREQGRLYGLAGFALAVAGLALFATRFGMPATAFLGSVLLVVYGNLVQQVVASRTGAAADPGLAASGIEREGARLVAISRDPAVPIVGFAIGGAFGAIGGIATVELAGGEIGSMPMGIFLVASGALLAGLVRAVLFERDDPLVMLSVGLVLWLFADLWANPPVTRVGAGLVLATGFGALAYAIGAASVSGMLAGILLALLAVVFGGYGWFAVLVSFFGIGGLVSKYRYEEKLERGLAQANAGARSSGNVLANATAALLALIGFAAGGRLGIDGSVFVFAFTGSVAAAMSDTVSSEIGGLYDRPRLITSLDPVEPGTDGGVTWQGELAGLVGAAVVAIVGVPFFGFSSVGVLVVVIAGVLGMTVDSLLGATLEGGVLGNQSVNLAATAAAAIVAGGLALGLGL